jgi:eukaryotic-like serine/threonine-protein kinase
MKPLFYCLSLGLAVFAVFSCKKGPTNPNTGSPLSSIKSIDSFTVEQPNGSSFNASDIYVTITAGDTILVTLPPYTDLTHLTPEITYKGVLVSPASGVALNLSSPVVFTVTAADSSKITYTVIVKSRGAVFFGTNDNRFFAVDAVTGTQVWKDSLAGDFQYNSPQLVDGVLYTASTIGVVYGLDPATGTIKWQFQAGGPVATTPAVVNGTVYFGCDDHNFYAVDLATAQLKWEFAVGGPTDSGPTVLNGIVYFAGGDGNMYALDAGSGAVVWKFNLNGVVGMAAPLVVNGLVYIGSRSDSLYALDATSGNKIWSALTDGYTLELSSPAIGSGLVYVGAESGSLFAFNATTGAQQWKSLINASIYDQPCIYNNTVYVTADDGTLDALNAQTGALLWQVASIYANGAGAIVANGSLYVGGGGSRYFYAFDPATGNVKWKFSTGNSLVLSYHPLYVPGN